MKFAAPSEIQTVNGYYVSLRMYFLGRVLRHGDASFWKLALFRKGKGRYECRLRDQDLSMADMEVHEHVVVDGPTSRLTNPLIHHNVESLSRYIQKHDEYSNWESHMLLRGEQNSSELLPALFRNSRLRGAAGSRRSFIRSGLSGAALPLSLFSASGIDGWDSGPDLLRVSSGADVSHEGQDLRTEIEGVEQKERKGSSRKCAALAAS